MKGTWSVKGALLVAGLSIAASTGHSQEVPRHRRSGRPVLNISGVLTNAVYAACRELGVEECAPLDVAVTELGSDLAHYEVVVRVGSGASDRIVLHRVVAEHWSGLPRDASHAVMMLPSHVFPFESFYLPPTCPGDATNNACAAASLAERGIDVWGMDFRTACVPDETDDFDFMEDWDLPAMVGDTRLAMLAARFARSATVRVLDPGLHLLGFGRSVWLAFAVADLETQLPPSRRSISGLISVDQAFRYGPEGESARLTDCAEWNYHQTSILLGDWEDSNQQLRSAGELAQTEPNDPSPYYDDVTNFEYALLVGCATYRQYAPVPHYHLVAGELDSDEKPIGLTYTSPQRWIDTMASAIPHESRAFFRDTVAIACGQTDVPFDDHLSEVKVPVLYLGAAGGYGELGIHSTTLLGCDDVTSIVVQHQTEENAALDFGHGDTWFSSAAETEVWEPLAEWIEAH